MDNKNYTINNYTISTEAITKKLPNKETFKSVLKQITLDLYIHDSKGIVLWADFPGKYSELYSLRFDIKNIGDDKYEISNICFQEEGNRYHFQCNNYTGKALYDIKNNKFETDIFLSDRHGDNFEMNLSQAISTVFDHYSYEDYLEEQLGEDLD